MGLDQYAYKRKVKWSKDYKTRVTRDNQIMYWRKHNRLEGCMEKIWRDKYDYVDMFNGQELYLWREDLENLKQIIENKELPETTGFFFGGDSYDDYEKFGYAKQDKEFIKSALKALDEGYEVIYTCSW